MVSLFQLFRHWLQAKVYQVWQNIKEERDRERLTGFKHIGKEAQLEGNSYYCGKEHMEIGDNFRCGSGAWVEAIKEYHGQQFHPNLKIGDNFNMQNNCHIGCIESIEIGNNVLLGSKVYITDHFHGSITKDDIDVPPILRPLSSKPVKIADNVWIGDNVCIMPGVTLGRNVIVGANAVVTKSFPDNTVIAGVPAKIIKTLL